MSELVVSGLFRYPVKSCKGSGLERAVLDARGITLDRHWMVVGVEGQFLTQRQLPRMALITPLLEEASICLQAPGMRDLCLPQEVVGTDLVKVQIWKDECLARSAGVEAASWLSSFLNVDCSLVYLPQDQVRTVDPDYGRNSDQVGFSDGYPLLLISEASLADLNSRMVLPLPMARFRPNLVVRGCEPYAEDHWKRICIGEIEFRVVKPCSRCAITTVDPDSAERGPEPLKTLNSYRHQVKNVYFGQNLIHDTGGVLNVGMSVHVLG